MKRLIALLTVLAMALMMNVALCEQEEAYVQDPVLGLAELESCIQRLIEEVPVEPDQVTPVELLPELPRLEMPPVDLPLAVEQQEEVYRSGMVLKGDSETGLMVLDAPGGQCIAVVNNGRMIGIGSIADGWAQISVDGLVGFVRSDYVALYNAETAPEEQVRSIWVDTNLQGMTQVKEGMTVCLTATLTGFENDVYTLQWQYSPDGGATAIDIAGANKTTYAYRLTVDNFDYMYRIVVSVEDEQADAAQ